ncbi:unnamed protein product [Blepharisma stoltei]|uniref:MORN repeat protein n=1 Tax=Blepharisma stoltei TaxID=1481888 RepID=A0AAU9I7A7_9CILI|nr:unnamed protein product [Blepharisma stoltei]
MSSDCSVPNCPEEAIFSCKCSPNSKICNTHVQRHINSPHELTQLFVIVNDENRDNLISVIKEKKKKIKFFRDKLTYDAGLAIDIIRRSLEIGLFQLSKLAESYDNLIEATKKINKINTQNFVCDFDRMFTMNTEKLAEEFNNYELLRDAFNDWCIKIMIREPNLVPIVELESKIRDLLEPNDNSWSLKIDSNFGNLKNAYWNPVNDSEKSRISLEGDIYHGGIKNNKPNGKGFLTLKNGGVYDGDFVDGKRCGKGKFISKGKDVYEGEWNNDLPNGIGKYTWAYGDIYEGSFVDGKCEGDGKCIYVNGNTYEGEWKDNQLNGKGKAVWATGKEYEGEIKFGVQEGYGVLKYKNGDVYEGEWKEDMPHGYGTWKYSNGDIYEGNMSQHRRNGYGKYIHANGDIYEGEWIDGLQNGKGKLILSTGEKFEGMFKDGRLAEDEN